VEFRGTLRYLYHGQIRSVTASDEELRIELDWLARDVNFPAHPRMWVAVYQSAYLDYRVSPVLYSRNGTVPGVPGSSRVHLNSAVLNEAITFLPPDDEYWLDPKLVEGLELAVA